MNRPRAGGVSVTALVAALFLMGCQMPRLPWISESPSSSHQSVPMPRADMPTSRVGPLAAQPAMPMQAAPEIPAASMTDGMAASDVYAGRPTHGALNRSLGERLDVVIGELLRRTKPAIEAVREGLRGAVKRLDPPLTLATNEGALRGWGSGDMESFQRKIDALYDVTQRQLENLHDVALATAEGQAVGLAPPRSLLDEGPTGNRTLDSRMTALAEVLDHATGLVDLRSEREQDRGRSVELIEVFNTFTNPAAEERLDGRLLLFIGGDQGRSLPQCVAAYRHDGPGDVGAYTLAQVVRHRIMRGDAVVYDLGWRAASGAAAGDGAVKGFPPSEVEGAFLIASSVEPFIDTLAPNFRKLRDMRIQVDTQTALIAPDGTVLGGVDWRVQFSVSTRGEMTWDISGGRPVYDPYCSELKGLLGQPSGS